MPTAAYENLTITEGSPILIPIGIIIEDYDGSESLLDTTDYTADFVIRNEDYDGEIIFSADETDYIALGYTPAPVVRNLAYTAGQEVIPADGPNGFIYRCTTAGTSHATNEPTWPLAVGLTVADGTVTWTCVANDETLVTFYLYVPSNITLAFDDWGHGVYTIELTDDFGHTQRILHGSCYLSRTTIYT